MPRSEKQRAHLDKVRPLSTAWHTTEEGQAWHSAQAERNWANPTLATISCAACGTEFTAPVMANARFCSTACSRRARDANHAHEVEVPCPVCGELFWQSAYRARPATCSRECGWAQRRAAPVEVELATAEPPSAVAQRRGERLRRGR